MKIAQKPTSGKILWSKKEFSSSKHSAWYDHTYWKVPVVVNPGETLDLTKARHALTQRLTVQFLSKFGGQSHVGEVTDLGGGFIQVETMYSIGD